MAGRLFGMKVKSKRRARMISISSPSAFRMSVKNVSRGRYSVADQRALQLAQNRARAQLKRKGLSMNERRQFRSISRMRIPKAGRR